MVCHHLIPYLHLDSVYFLEYCAVRNPQHLPDLPAGTEVHVQAEYDTVGFIQLGQGLFYGSDSLVIVAHDVAVVLILLEDCSQFLWFNIQ